MIVVIFLLGVGLIASILIYTSSDSKSTEAYTGAVAALLAQQKKALTTDDFVKSMTETKLQMETLEQRCEAVIEHRLQEIDAKVKKLASEQDFMRAHQHGMDKRIAGTKKEIIFNINRPIPVELIEPPPKNVLKKSAAKPKPLLEKAGVTQ